MTDKEETVVLRLSAQIKAEIQAAAQSAGQPITTFITDAALKKAHQLKAVAALQGVRASVPAYFRALCLQAANGANGYAKPGWHLAAGIGAEQPRGIGADEWERRVDALKALLANRDEDAVWAWFVQNFPDSMALIPARRRQQFLYGVRLAYEEGRIDL